MDIENLRTKAEIAISRWTGCSSETTEHATRAVLAIALAAELEAAIGQRDFFNRHAAGLTGEDYALGYREALDHSEDRLRTLATQLGDKTDD